MTLIRFVFFFVLLCISVHNVKNMTLLFEHNFYIVFFVSTLLFLFLGTSNIGGQNVCKIKQGCYLYKKNWSCLELYVVVYIVTLMTTRLLLLTFLWCVSGNIFNFPGFRTSVFQMHSVWTKSDKTRVSKELNSDENKGKNW